MHVTALFIDAFSIILLAAAFWFDRNKAKQALGVAFRSFVSIIPTVLIIIILIGLLLTFVPSEKISAIVGEQSGFGGVLLVAVLGSLMHIPSLISFPLAASILKNGASLVAVAAFITTLTMIGLLTLPLEIKALGKKMAFMRNGFSFIIALIIAMLIGWML